MKQFVNKKTNIILETSRRKLRQVKQGMMQVLLTGKVRLVGGAEKELQNT